MSAAVHNGGEPNHSEASIDGTAGSRENDSDSRDDKISSDLDDNDIANTFTEVKLEEDFNEKDLSNKDEPKQVTKTQNTESAASIPVESTVQLRSPRSTKPDEKRLSSRNSQISNDVIAPPVVSNPSPSGTSKLETFRRWSINQIFCTKQLFAERLGKASVTVDSDVQLQIDITRDTQLKLDQMHQEAKTLTTAVAQMVQSQQALHSTFRELAQKMPDLNGEFECNADSLKAIFKKGETLIGDLNFFTSNVATLCGKTIEDTVLTIEQYESARLEYDAHRTRLEMDLKNPAKVEEAQRQLEPQREKFERLRADILIKMKLMNENKLKVMRKQLFLLHCSVTTYITELNSVMLDQQKKFKMIRSNTVETNFLSEEI